MGRKVLGGRNQGIASQKSKNLLPKCGRAWLKKVNRLFRHILEIEPRILIWLDWVSGDLFFYFFESSVSFLRKIYFIWII